MQSILPRQLQLLASKCPTPLYVVGGSVRDYLCGFTSSNHDWDICAPLCAEKLTEIALLCNFTINAVYKNTGTVKLQDCEGIDYEYTCFRSDQYVRGVHVPVQIYFTDDITADAKRRDFTANAVYYDIAKGEYVDPLQGIPAIKEKRLTTVAPAEKVFGEDGLRLLRLARQAAQLGFTPDEECLQGATKNAALITDISAERIFSELQSLLSADEKHGNTDGPYQGLQLLKTTGILRYILPELSAGENMQQRSDYHDHDVLEHSFRAVKYATKEVRLAALLHDAGKPFCTLRDGNAHMHPEEGARIAKEILTRFKASKQLLERIPALIKWHMYDLNGQTRENKLRRFFVSHSELLPALLELKQADFSACKDNLSQAPTCKRWLELLQRMRLEKVPFSLKELAINGNDLLNAGICPKHISSVLKSLLLHTAVYPNENEKTRLLKLAKAFERNL